MKGRAKDRIKLALIIGVALVATILIVSIISGRISTAEIIIVDKEGININQPLDQQLEYFKSIEISKSEFENFGNSIVTDFSELTNKIPRVELQVGSPIPFNLLMEPDSGGRFATSLEEGQTVYFIPQGGVGLPPIEKGDKINLGITYQSQNEYGENQHSSSIILYDLELANVVGFDLYPKVTLQQHVDLQTLSKVGDFFVQLPGKQALPFCSDLDEDEVDETTKCLDEDYLPDQSSQSGILERLSRGEALNRTDKEVQRELQRLLEEQKEAEKQDKEDEEKDEETNITIPSELEIGETFEGEHFNLTLNEVSKSNSEEYGELTNDHFVIGNITIENTSEEAFNLNTVLDIRLTDSEGTEFTLSSDLINSLDRNIEPGEVLDGNFPFDTVESDNYELKLNDFDEAVWSFKINN